MTKNILKIILLSLIFINATNLWANNNDTYILATGDLANERLVLQDKLLRENSNAHLINAGISSGQVVWDVGCGNGIMTEYMAQLVGESGHVYAMDINIEQLTIAKERIKSAGLNNVTFILGDIISQDNLPKGVADIVYARLLLMHVQHPEEAIKKMKMLLKPNGVIASQESIMSTIYSSYQTKVFDKYADAVIALGKLKGVDYDIGNRLKELYESLDFSRVDQYYRYQKISAQDAQKLFLLGFSEWKSKALDLNILTREEIDYWHEILKKIPVNDASLSFFPSKQSYILAWNNESKN